MPARSALTLFHFRGIRIGIDYSWFFILFLLIVSLSSSFKDTVTDSGDGMAYVLAVVSALAFFGSILLHELGHAVVSIRKGIPISDITLWMFGGIARMTRDSDSPGTEFQIAVAGPAVTGAIIALCAGLGILIGGSDDLWHAMTFENGPNVSAGLVVLGWLVQVNVFVLIFNLLPAYPLDGGRIARSIAWRITGNRNK